MGYLLRLEGVDDTRGARIVSPGSPAPGLRLDCEHPVKTALPGGEYRIGSLDAGESRIVPVGGVHQNRVMEAAASHRHPTCVTTTQQLTEKAGLDRRGGRTRGP